MLGGRECGAGSDGRRGESACGAHKLGARPAEHREGLGGGHCVYVGVRRGDGEVEGGFWSVKQ